MDKTNCPNCDAVLSYDGGLHCSYCGAWFEKPDCVTIREWDGTPFCTLEPSDWPSPPKLETR